MITEALAKAVWGLRALSVALVIPFDIDLEGNQPDPGIDPGIWVRIKQQSELRQAADALRGNSSKQSPINLKKLDGRLLSNNSDKSDREASLRELRVLLSDHLEGIRVEAAKILAKHNDVIGLNQVMAAVSDGRLNPVDALKAIALAAPSLQSKYLLSFILKSDMEARVLAARLMASDHGNRDWLRRRFLDDPRSGHCETLAVVRALSELDPSFPGYASDILKNPDASPFTLQAIRAALESTISQLDASCH